MEQSCTLNRGRSNVTLSHSNNQSEYAHPPISAWGKEDTEHKGKGQGIEQLLRRLLEVRNENALDGG